MSAGVAEGGGDQDLFVVHVDAKRRVNTTKTGVHCRYRSLIHSQREVGV